MTEIPSFEEAVTHMREFLRDNSGLTEPIQWVFREDIIRYDKRIFVMLPVSTSNPEKARNFYEKGIREEYGVRLVCGFVVDATPYCYVWILSESEVETGCLFQKNNFMLTALEPLNEAIPVRSSLKWRVLKLVQEKEVFAFDTLPSWNI